MGTHCSLLEDVKDYLTGYDGRTKVNYPHYGQNGSKSIVDKIVMEVYIQVMKFTPPL